METVKVDTKDLNDYLNHLSRGLTANLVEIEVAGLELGDQIEVEWAPLTRISFDPKNEEIVVNLDDGKVEHFIRKPVEFWVRKEGGSVKTINVKSSEGLQHLIHFKEPLKLPPLSDQ